MLSNAFDCEALLAHLMIDKCLSESENINDANMGKRHGSRVKNKLPCLHLLSIVQKGKGKFFIFHLLDL